MPLSVKRKMGRDVFNLLYNLISHAMSPIAYCCLDTVK